MRLRQTVLAALLAAPAALGWHAAHADFINGARLMQACSSRESARQADCDAYAAGVLDMALRGNGTMAQDLRACLTKGATLREIRDTIVRYGRDHADAARGSGPALVLAAVRAKYRCGAQ